jgi:pimeloyl-ACP methyl ester carboxylesterase
LTASPRPEPTTSDIHARGTRVRLVEAGAGHPLLLVHGYLSSHLTWAEVMGELSSSFRVIAPDLPGFGESEKPAPSRYAYGFDTFADTLADVVAALGLSRVSVCGHGLGGSIALTLAANHPDLVDRLVLVDPLVYTVRLGTMARIAALPILGPVAFKQLYGRAMFRRYFREQFYKSTSVPWSRVDTHYDLFNAPLARQAAYATTLAILDTRAVVAKVPRVVVPTLVGWGREDASSPIADGRRLVRELRGARFEVFESGHAPQEECPETFARVVKRFLLEATGKAA